MKCPHCGFLNREAARGVTIYRCTGCAFRGMGAAVTYHDREGHETYAEPRKAVR